MIALLCFVLNVLISPFKSKSRLEAENAALRHQIVVFRRIVHRRVRLTNSDRLFFIQLYRWFPSGGRPQVDTELRASIRRMSIENQLWGENPSAPDLANLCSLLQRYQNALVAGQRCTGLSSHSAYRNHQLTRDPWRTASPLRPDLGFRYTQVDLCALIGLNW